MKLGTIFSLLSKMRGREHLADYAKTLIGPRTRGSTTTAGIETLSPNLVGKTFVPETGAVPGCTYVHFEAPSLNGRLGAVSLENIPDEDLSLVRVRKGPHGHEFYIDRPQHEGISCSFITVILGPDDNGDDIVWTWHPGLPLEPMNHKGAVKLHNG